MNTRTRQRQSDLPPRVAKRTLRRVSPRVQEPRSTRSAPTASASVELTNDAASSVAPLFDQQTLMRRVGADTDRLRELTQLFLQALPQDLSALRKEIENGNARGAAKLAHSVAGSFAALAMDQLAALAIELEIAATSGDCVACEQLFQALETRCMRAVSELERFVRSA